jgi:hypothetical protein
MTKIAGSGSTPKCYGSATLEILFLREALIFQIVEEEEQFQLTIVDVAHEGRQYTLPFPASKRVADVKRVAAVVTAIPVFRPVFHLFRDRFADPHKCGSRSSFSH